jgi:hypothetical protein
MTARYDYALRLTDKAGDLGLAIRHDDPPFLRSSEIAAAGLMVAATCGAAWVVNQILRAVYS